MAGLLFSELTQHEPIQKVIVHSVDLALYQVSVVINHVEYYLKEDNGQFVKALNPLEVQKRFDGISYLQMVLRHESAYDEMVGQPLRDGRNVLEVPFGQNRLY
ncbi:hypothetical protein PALB_22700 [Pseudoalteromonas luteoviolacea B = ATCC 29581]|nr:hypothetical protein PALB_22700 [Pseudoalteromonas luteoviolacea B = ATCC 29581]